MDILKALRAEESKFLGQMEAAKQQVDTVRTAIKLLGGSICEWQPRLVGK